jgi:Skp family chaperone for outer membrane proteins
MRRPNRSIEVFDISLMAVVTKAMGAFLVLMLLLMPYYSSGPVGEKTAAELAEELKEAQKKLNNAIENLKRGEITPEELERLKRLLEDTQRRLQQAQTLADRLKRENDQLNSQVARLENELQDSKQKLAQEQKKNEELRNELALLSNPVLSVHVVNSDCLDVVLDVVMWDRTRDTIEFIKRKPVKYSLNYWSPGQSFTNRSLLAKETVTGFRSIVSSRPRIVFLVARDRAYANPKIDGEDSFLLKKTRKVCHITINSEKFIPETGKYEELGTVDSTIAASTYGKVLWGAKVVKDDIVLTDPTKEDVDWLQEQVAKAKKAPEPKPPPPKEEKPISKQEALAAIEKLPVARSVNECMRLVGRAGEILSRARVQAPRAAAGSEIQSACISKHFDEARKTLQAVALEAITGKKPEDNKPAKPLSKQEALAEIEKLAIPHSVSECMSLVSRTGGILSQARVRMPRSAPLGGVHDACVNNRFDDARETVQALAREAITGKSPKDNKPSKPLTKQEALAEIEKFPVPHSVGECMGLIRQAGSIVVRLRGKFPEGDWMGNIQQACVTNHFDAARKIAQMAARDGVEGKKPEDNKPQPSKPLSKQEALVEVEKLSLPHSGAECVALVEQAGSILARSQAKLPNGSSLAGVQRACATSHFDEALTMAQTLVRDAITANGKGDGAKQLPSKNTKEAAPISKQQALGLVERMPVPRDPNACMQMLMRAMRLQVIMHVEDAQSKSAIPAIRDDCEGKHFEDALQKTKAEMHRVLK